jgi:hypothetical protein
MKFVKFGAVGAILYLKVGANKILSVNSAFIL